MIQVLHDIVVPIQITMFIFAFAAAAYVNFSQSVYEVEESSGFAEICVDLDGTLEDYLTVYLLTNPGTASGKSDGWNNINIECVFLWYTCSG